MAVSVIIPSFNAGPVLPKCLDSILMQEGVVFEIIVLNDNSNDESAAVLETYRQQHDIRVYTNTKNLGYAPNCAIGATYAKHDTFVFMNSDAFFQTKDDLRKAEAYLQDRKVGVIGFYNLNPDHTPQFIGANADIFMHLDTQAAQPEYVARLLAASKQHNNEVELFMTSGACYATRRDVYEQVGGLDDSYFIYVEEVDFMWRVRLFGYRVVTHVDLPIIHLGGFSTFKYNNETTARKIFLREKNAWTTILKNYQWFTLLLIVPLAALENMVEIIYLLCTGKWAVVGAYIAGYAENIKKWRSTWQKRRYVQQHRVVGDWTLFGTYIHWRWHKLDFIRAQGIPKFKA